MLIRLGYILDDKDLDEARYCLTVRNGKKLFDYIGIRVLDTDRLELKDLSIEDALELGLIKEDDNRKVNIFGTHKPEWSTTSIGLLFYNGEIIKCRREYSPLFRLPLGGCDLEFLVDANNADFAVFVDGDMIYNGTEYSNIDTCEGYARVFADVSDKLYISTFSGWLTDIRCYSNEELYMFVLSNGKVCLNDLTSECNPIILPYECTELCIINDSFWKSFYINSDNRLSEDKLLNIVIPPSITKFSINGVTSFRRSSWFNLRLIISKQSAYKFVKNITEVMSNKSENNRKLKNQSKLEDCIKYLYENFNINIEFY